NHVAVLELDLEHGVGQRLLHRPLEHDGIFFGFGQVDLRLGTTEPRDNRRAAAPRGANRQRANNQDSGTIAPRKRAGHKTVNTSGPWSVMAMVCSKWAERLPSAVTTLQPSSRRRVPGLPVLIMGSTANTIPVR